MICKVAQIKCVIGRVAQSERVIGRVAQLQRVIGRVAQLQLTCPKTVVQAYGMAVVEVSSSHTSSS